MNNAEIAYYWRVEEHGRGDDSCVRFYGGRPYPSPELAFEAMMEAMSKTKAFPKDIALEYIVFEDRTSK